MKKIIRNEAYGFYGAIRHYARTRAHLGIQEAPLGMPYRMAMVYAVSQFECEVA